jgi:hypothetical protein
MIVIETNQAVRMQTDSFVLSFRTYGARRSRKERVPDEAARITGFRRGPGQTSPAPGFSEHRVGEPKRGGGRELALAALASLAILVPRQVRRPL